MLPIGGRASYPSRCRNQRPAYLPPIAEVLVADSPVWFRFFIEDFERDTRDLNPEETGIYLRLMLWYYSSTKPIPNTDLWRVAARIGLPTGPQLERPDPIAGLRHVLDTYFSCEDGFFFHHKRIEAELAHWRKVSGVGKTAAEKRWKINGSDADALPPQCHGNANQNQNQKEKTLKPSSSPNGDGRFQEFWKSYPRKVGKAAALKAWKRIKPNDDLAERMLHAVSEQSKSEDWRKDRGKYIPHPTTWLNGGRWDDEQEEQAGARLVRGCRICGTTGSIVESQGGPLCIAHWNAGER